MGAPTTGARGPGDDDAGEAEHFGATPPVVRREDGIEESAAFDDAGRLVFHATPVGSAAATLVVASSLFAELQRNYRREVLLARAAVAAGFASIRFHYRGSGNSFGTEGPTLGSMIEDVLDIAGAVPGPVVLVGTRLGALAVARARREMDVPAVLWEPVVDGTRWVDEVIRAALIREVAQRTAPVGADAIRRRWSDEGRAFVLGETVPSGIVEQVGATTLTESLGGVAPVLVVQMGRDDRIRPDLERVRTAVAERDIPVEVLAVVGRQTWWVNEGGDLFRPVERDGATGTLIAGILDFAGRVTG